MPAPAFRSFAWVLLAIAAVGCKTSQRPVPQEAGALPSSSAPVADAAPPGRSTPLGHSSGVRMVAFSPGGEWLASSGGAGELLLWDVRRSTAVALLTKHVQAPDMLRWDSSGARLASVRVSDLDLIDVASRKVLWTVHTHAGQVWKAVAWSRSGDGLVVRTSDDAVQWIDTASGKVVCAVRHSKELSPEDVPSCGGEAKAKELDPSHGDPLIWKEWAGKSVHASLLSPDHRKALVSGDGKLVAVVPGDTGRIELRDASTGALRLTLATNQAIIEELAFADDDRALLVAGFHNRAQLYALPSGARKLDIPAGRNGVSSISLDIGSSTLATSSGLDASVMLWDSKTGALRGRLTPGVVSYGVPKPAPGGQRLLAYSTTTGLHAWDLADRKITTLAGPFEDLEGWGWAGDQAVWLLSRDGSLKQVDATTAQPASARKLPGWPDLSNDSSRPQVTFGPGARFVAVLRPTALHVWDVKTGRALPLKPLGGSEVYHVAFSPTGDELVVAGWDTAEVIDLAHGKSSAQWAWSPAHKKRPRNSMQGDAFLAMDWAGPFVLAAWLVSGTGTTLELWDAAHGQKVSSTVCKDNHLDFAFSPKADRVLVDGAKVVQARTCKEVSGGERTRGGAWGPKGAWYAVAPGDGLMVYSLEGKPPMALHPVALDAGWTAQ